MGHRRPRNFFNWPAEGGKIFSTPCVYTHNAQILWRIQVWVTNTNKIDPLTRPASRPLAAGKNSRSRQQSGIYNVKHSLRELITCVLGLSKNLSRNTVATAVTLAIRGNGSQEAHFSHSAGTAHGAPPQKQTGSQHTTSTSRKAIGSAVWSAPCPPARCRSCLLQCPVPVHIPHPQPQGCIGKGWARGRPAYAQPLSP